MRQYSLSLIIVATIAGSAKAQFYPDTTASWCLEGTQASQGYNLRMQTFPPDTLIVGVSYTRILEHSNLTGVWGLTQRYYVRSAADGKGYAFLPDSATEYLTGDAFAQVGDTLFDVLVRDDECHNWGTVLYVQKDIIVDSVMTMTNNGVSVVRQHVSTPCFPTTAGFDPERFFWQPGMGTSHGPMLQVRSGFTSVNLSCCMVGDTNHYSAFIGGLPGDITCCGPIALDVGEAAAMAAPGISVFPNPATDRLTVTLHGVQGQGVAQARVIDVLGKEVLQVLVQGASWEIDVSQLQGPYMLVIDHGSERYCKKVIIN